jgi:hypothetical protein
MKKNVKPKVLIGEGYANVTGKVLISAASGWDDMVKTLGIIIYGVPKEDFVKGKIKA